ncbi:hypothetical protein QR680_018158 [Steinernema hermaphroditum]|uniref:Piwi domain-containing protein n=1 Tax=Steinernema hermaphroditum TaxID=289476 RepID=A0AA39HJ50_9BILA|nr:hypothetical protein QR680_018155 [Steinernema hermaphroditum]KAK0405723.1 hypothetical protein QR680_018158 [Steinernema hermaphroditum]
MGTFRIANSATVRHLKAFRSQLVIRSGSATDPPLPSTLPATPKMSGEQQQTVELREKTKIRQEADRLFKEEYGIEVGSTEVPPKMEQPAGDASVNLVANLFPLRTHQQMPIYRWDVEMTIALRNGKQLSLTKKSDSDAVAVDRKQKTRWIFKRMVETNAATFGRPEENYYDLEATLFTLKDIRAAGQDELNLVVNGLDAVLFQGSASASVVLRKVTDRYEVSLTDFSHLTRNCANADLSHKQFLEVATSQYPLMSDQFVCYPGGVSFDVNEDVTQLEEGKYLGHGVQKSIRYIEGADKKAHAAIAVDLKKTAFHAEISALEYLQRQSRHVSECLQRGQRLPPGAFAQTGPCRKLKGLRCVLIYATQRRREIVIHDVVNQTASEVYFDLEGGQKKSVAQYFRERYQIRLQYLQAPLAVEKKPGSRELCYYPLECIRVVENQRVSGELSQQVIREVIKHAAVVPAQRQAQIMDAFQNLHLPDSAHLDSVATSVTQQMLPLKGREIRKPTLVYGQAQKAVPQNGKWTMPGRGSSFAVPAKLGRWTCMMLTTERQDAAQRMMTDFLKKYVAECRQRGMIVDQPVEPYVLPAGDFEPAMDGFMNEALSEYKLDFVLCIQDKPIHEHKFLKYLERKYGLITQDVATPTVRRCLERGASATIENIVQKTNMKLGGLNYGLEMKSPSGRADVLEPTTMFVGLGMCHSKPPKPDATGKEPPRPASVVGFAANVLAQSFAFIGDYFYQAADRDEKIFSIVPIVTRLLTQWCEHHSGQMPKNIVFFRNGGSEGQYQLILKYEVPLIRFAIDEFRQKSAVQQHFETKVVVVVATKRHNVRFFKTNIRRDGRAPEQNLQPGIAIDSTVTHPVFSEFFVNSHTTLQGTGRTPRYTVLYNESGFKLGQLEHIVYALSHGHQIVNLTTSLPTPAYIANDYAERGMAVLNQFLFNHADVSRDAYDTFNKELTFAAMDPESLFHRCRVNA